MASDRMTDPERIGEHLGSTVKLAITLVALTGDNPRYATIMAALLLEARVYWELSVAPTGAGGRSPTDGRVNDALETATGWLRLATVEKIEEWLQPLAARIDVLCEEDETHAAMPLDKLLPKGETMGRLCKLRRHLLSVVGMTEDSPEEEQLAAAPLATLAVAEWEVTREKTT